MCLCVCCGHTKIHRIVMLHFLVVSLWIVTLRCYGSMIVEKKNSRIKITHIFAPVKMKQRQRAPSNKHHHEWAWMGRKITKRNNSKHRTDTDSNKTKKINGTTAIAKCQFIIINYRWKCRSSLMYERAAELKQMLIAETKWMGFQRLVRQTDSNCRRLFFVFSIVS